MFEFYSLNLFATPCVCRAELITTYAMPTSLPPQQTLGELKAAGWRSRSLKAELRDNLIDALQNDTAVFPEVLGYEDTVMPALKTAILAQHNVLLLGLRGQAKTRIARLMTHLLDEWMPIIAGSELNDDPLRPMSAAGRAIVDAQGDNTPIEWVHRDDRYFEKLATPDVSVADLIGDIDPIKAANERLSYSDERVIHFGLVPRANRCIFVINELPDLQARIQVALFNILSEGDLQIRGFKLRLHPDVQFVFTANPEDYTNRGSIVTPLKDRIEAQILTHYPKSVDISRQITTQEAELTPEQQQIEIPELLKLLIEEIAFAARESEYIDQKSGVSARLTIAAYEQLVSAVELRRLESGQTDSQPRLSDLQMVLPAITGKVELVYEGEQEGASGVARQLIGKALRKKFTELFPDPEASKKRSNKGREDDPVTENPYERILNWFAENELDILREDDDDAYGKKLNSVDGLYAIVDRRLRNLDHHERLLMMEFVLHGLAECSQLTRSELERGIGFRDMLGGLFGNITFGDEDYE